MSYIKHFM